MGFRTHERAEVQYGRSSKMQAWYGRLSCAVCRTTRRVVSLPASFFVVFILLSTISSQLPILRRFKMLSEMLLVCDQAKERRRKAHPEDHGCSPGNPGVSAENTGVSDESPQFST